MVENPFPFVDDADFKTEPFGEVPEFNEFRNEGPALAWLARELEIGIDKLAKILREVEGKNPQSYRLRTKRKKDGGRRVISIPNNDLKKIQRLINRLVRKSLWPAKVAYGFSGGSIIDAITPHLTSGSILCLDLEDAFPSVSYETVLRLFTEGRKVWYRWPYRPDRVENYGFMSWYAARIAAELVTWQDSLPQGAPTSPRIFDLVCRHMDVKLQVLAERIGGRYTRYADNIFFSMPQPGFPIKVKNAVLRRVEREGFRPHKIRTREMDRGALHMLGLNVIGGRIHNTRDFKRRLRLAIHHIVWLLDNSKADTPEFEKAWLRLRGQIAFAITDTLPATTFNAYRALEARIN